LVSTVSADGVTNLAPFSFFQAGGTSPVSLVFSASLDEAGNEKHTVRNIRARGDYVINVVTREMADAMVRTSAPMASDESEWGAVRFTPLASEVVAPARVAESPCHFECRMFQIVEHGNGHGAARYVIGEVVRIHVSEALQNDGVLNPESVRTLGRMGGEWYIDTAALEVFRMPRRSEPPSRH
jgi:flavin reductase (DIM6/NTAB) family NADH-FMN oxidoreductase RutF